MKLNKFFMLGLAGLAFAACSNEDDIANVNNDDQTLVVKLAGISADTRTSGQWTADTEAKDNIISLTLLLTDANGDLKYAPQTVTGDNLTAIKGSGVKYTGVKGVTAVHAIANKAIKLNAGDNISQLNATLSEQAYSINKATQVIYVGSDVNINPLNPESTTTAGLPEVGLGEPEGNFYYAAEVKLVPAISRIQITKISVATSGDITFPSADEGTITAGKFKLAWQNFKPVLNGVYLNNFSSQSNLFAKTVATPLLKNDSYMQKITEGKWMMGTTDYASSAAYISYANSTYGALLNYAATPTTGNVELLMPADNGVNQCIAFNVFVPFDPANGTPSTIANPTIHFQFDKAVTGYSTAITLADGNDTPVTDAADMKYIATASTGIDYTLPSVADGGFLFANINNLYTDAAATTALALAPGKIYNMEVVINPVNMTIDLNNPQTYNVVVKVTVQPFTVQDIYPGLGE